MTGTAETGRLHSRVLTVRTLAARGVLAALTVLIGGVASPAAAQAQWDWAWGELLYGRAYVTSLTITNTCDNPQPVTIRVEDPVTADGRLRRTPERTEPFDPDAKAPLSARELVSFPAAACAQPPAGAGFQRTTCQLTVEPGDTPLEIVITTPPPPDLRTLELPPDFEPHDWYDEIEGTVEIVGGSPVCFGERNEYWTSGHVHFDPNPPAGGGGARGCEVWWEAGTYVPGIDDCTDEFRRLATILRTELESVAAQAPDDWAWLPTVEQIQSMAAGELLGMKTRAEAQRRSQP